jgi:hypothetical protein
MADKKMIPIYQTRTDIPYAKFHPLRLRGGIRFLGFQLREDALVKTPMGASKALRDEWVVIFPDGKLYRVTNELFRKMFRTDIIMDSIGAKCFCGGQYHRVGGRIMCNHCGDALAGLDISDMDVNWEDDAEQQD